MLNVKIFNLILAIWRHVTFCIDELMDALSNSKDSAVGPDDIHYQMLKLLPSETLNTLFEYYE